jgi:hypothetical protein
LETIPDQINIIDALRELAFNPFFTLYLLDFTNNMKFISILVSTALFVLSVSAAQNCAVAKTSIYQKALDYSSTLQDLIDEASRLK